MGTRSWGRAAFGVAMALATGLAAAQSLPPASRTAYKCIDGGKAGSCVGRVAESRDALWRIVHDQCAVNPTATSPCVVYAPRDGYGLIKDRNGFEQYLLIATDRISGIEDPVLYEPAHAGLLAAAWNLQAWPARKIGHAIPADQYSIAINSSHRRSQDQLHIHLDCVTVGVHEALAREHPGATWAPLGQTLADAHWVAMAVDSLDASQAPLAWLKMLPESMVLADVSLLVVGAPPVVAANGNYWLLASTETSSETLQDHLCAIGAATP